MKFLRKSTKREIEPVINSEICSLSTRSELWVTLRTLCLTRDAQLHMP